MKSIADGDRATVPASCPPTSGGEAVAAAPDRALQPHRIAAAFTVEPTRRRRRPAAVTAVLIGGRILGHLLKSATVRSGAGSWGRVTVVGLAAALALWIVAARYYGPEAPRLGAALVPAALIALLLHVLGRNAGAGSVPPRTQARDEARSKAALADVAVRTLVLLVPMVAVVLLAAPAVMVVLAPEQADAAALLQLFALACIPWAVVSVAATWLRIEGRILPAFGVAALAPAVVLVVAVPVISAWGAWGLAAAWLAAHTVVATAIGAVVIGAGKRGGSVGWLLAIVAAGARLVAAVTLAERMAPAAHVDAAAASELLATSPDPLAVSWRPLGVLPSRGDVLIDFLGEESEAAATAVFEIPPGTRAFLKRGVSAEGMRSLERQRANLAMLHAEPGLAGCGIAFPDVVAFKRIGDEVWSVERAIDGVDGRIVLRDPLRRDTAVTAACAAIGDIHGRTARPAMIDNDWIDRWIDRPACLLRNVSHTLMTRGARTASIEAFRQRQRKYWHGRRVALGVYHGDYSPGNVLFRDDASGPLVNGIIDWDRAGRDGPRGFDACHFMLAAQRVDNGEQIGEIVRGLLLSPTPWAAGFPGHDLRVHLDLVGQWDEAASSSANPAGDRETTHAMIGLAWLRLVAANIEKSQAFALNRLWSAANVERVLELF